MIFNKIYYDFILRLNVGSVLFSLRFLISVFIVLALIYLFFLKKEEKRVSKFITSLFLFTIVKVLGYYLMYYFLLVELPLLIVLIFLSILICALNFLIYAFYFKMNNKNSLFLGTGMFILTSALDFFLGLYLIPAIMCFLGKCPMF